MKIVKLKQPSKTPCIRTLESAIKDCKDNRKDVRAIGIFIRLKDETILKTGYEKKGKYADALIGAQVLSREVMKDMLD